MVVVFQRIHPYAAMSLAKLLKFDLSPQLARPPDCKLWLTRGMEVPDDLEKVAFATVNDKAIVDGWDDMLRLVASIMTGRVTVSWVLARNGSAAAGDGASDGHRRLLSRPARLDPAGKRELVRPGDHAFERLRPCSRRMWRTYVWIT